MRLNDIIATEMMLSLEVGHKLSVPSCDYVSDRLEVSIRASSYHPVLILLYRQPKQVFPQKCFTLCMLKVSVANAAKVFGWNRSSITLT
jgi:hypothetical protein